MNLSTIDYKPLDDIASIFLNETSLNNINSAILLTNKYKNHLNDTIKQKKIKLLFQDRADELSETTILNNALVKYNETKDKAKTTETSINSLTEGISQLDNSKHNLVQTLIFFQNFKILVDSYFECKQLLQKSAYIEMVSSYKIMCALTENTFGPFKSVDIVNEMLISIETLKLNITKNIKKLFTQILKTNVQINENLQKQLRDGACELINSEEKTRKEIIDWLLERILYELKEIFQLDDEAGSLENLSRRFIYFKKLLNNFNSKYASYFLPSWEIPLQLTNKFYQITRSDLKVLLHREFGCKNPSIDLFMQSLQITLDFEKYIDVRFSNKCKEEKLSSQFEPYLSLWVSHQNEIMEKKLLSYMSEARMPTDPSASLVIPSSADLFRTYRKILTETLELVGESKNESILISLSNFFAKWLIEYLNKILKPLYVADDPVPKEQHNMIKYTVLLVNTCDYCSITIDQLEEKLSVFSSNSRDVSNPFIRSKDLYDELLSKCNNFLLKKALRMDLSFVTKEFDNTDWAHITVEDYSRYMVTLKKVLTFSDPLKNEVCKSCLQEVIMLLNRDVYKWNFFNNFIDSLTSTYVECVVRLLQPLPPFGELSKRRSFDIKQVINIGEQLLLDVELLRNILNLLSENIVGSNSNLNSSYKRTKKHIENNLDMLLAFFKLLVVPVTSPNDYITAYARLTSNNKNPLVWAFTFSLKGAPWDIDLWKEHWRSFESWRKTDTTGKNDLFIYKWNSKNISRYEINLKRIQNSTWKEFVRTNFVLTS